MASLLKKVQKGVKDKVQQAKTNVANRRGSTDETPTKDAGEDSNEFAFNGKQHLETPITIQGKFWKRRSGLGQYKIKVPNGASPTTASNNNWEQRRFELRGTTLIYYEEDTTTPRGQLDLEKEKATVHASMGHQVGAPSPFCLSIAVDHQTKWKLAFDEQSALMQWLAALTNVVVQCSVDGYNVQLLQAADPTHQNEMRLRRPRTVYEPSSMQQQSQGAAQPHHQLWLTEDYTISSKSNGIEKSGEATANSDDSTTTSALEQKHQSELEQRQAAYTKSIQMLQEKIVELTTASAEARARHNQEIKDLQQELKQFARYSSAPDNEEDDDDSSGSENYH